MTQKTNKPEWAYLLFFIGVLSLAARTLLDSNFANSALLYVAFPFVISFLIYRFTSASEGRSLAASYGSHARSAAIVMLGSSAILFEGFLCVLFFMPIYFAIITIDFWIRAWSARRKAAKETHLRATLWPLAVSVLAAEGLAPSTSFERQNQVTRTVIVQSDITALKANMAAPINLPKERNWFLSIFPLPVNVQAGTLAAGDVHTMDFIYKRWFFTNIKTGEFHLKISEVGDNYVRTEVLKNTSYLANYLEINGTEVDFTPLPSGATEVALTIHYDRKLDPAWYFAPMQEFAIEKSADYLINAVIAKDLPRG